MKNTKSIAMIAAGVFSLTLGIQSTRAQDYNASVNAVLIETNSSGNLIYHRFRNRDIINECAHEKGITNTMGLSLVYNRTADALHVVMGTNHTVVCTPLTFAGGTWLINSNHTRAERLTWVYVETNTMAGGTLAATETFHYGPSNTLTGFVLSGNLQYTAADGTNGPAIYRGSLHAASGDFDDDDHEGSHGDD
ncbi:MAG TPA: hypothetical protein VNZ64_12945 [Candidatus Acidoferrum sp.]|jgi:hypothetical protein|nr:hypothetical protein [Candidatus Acidoferrum sp.]